MVVLYYRVSHAGQKILFMNGKRDYNSSLEHLNPMPGMEISKSFQGAKRAHSFEILVAQKIV